MCLSFCFRIAPINTCTILLFTCCDESSSIFVVNSEIKKSLIEKGIHKLRKGAYLGFVGEIVIIFLVLECVLRLCLTELSFIFQSLCVCLICLSVCAFKAHR